MHKLLTQQQIDAFQSEGVVQIKGLFKTRLRRSVRELIATWRSRGLMLQGT